MPKRSAGLLLYRRRPEGLEVMLVHPGGPYWRRRDDAAWSIPKGEREEGEEPLAAALREFEEEIGQAPPEGAPVELGQVRQAAGKVVSAWAIEADIDISEVDSVTFEMEWPPRSGRMREFPEVDRAGWFDLATARRKIVRAQAPLLDALAKRLGERA